MHLEVKHFTNSKILTFNSSQFYTLNPSNRLRKQCSKCPGHDSAPEQRPKQLLGGVGGRGGAVFPPILPLDFHPDLPTLIF